jgi:hypothetical protein
MTNSSDLRLIYRIFKQEQEDEKLARQYHVCRVYSDTEFASEEILQEIKHSLLQEERSYFRTMEELQQFALLVVQKFRASQIILLSVEDYNLAVESVHDLVEYRELFKQHGEVVKSGETLHRPRLLLHKLFSKRVQRKSTS